MKPFEYYAVNSDDFPSRTKYRKQLLEAINNEKLTHGERSLKLLDVDRISLEWFILAVKPFNEEEAKKREQFWQDASENLGYASWPQEAIHRLESEAWEDGHANGFSEVYYHLEKLKDFTDDILQGFKLKEN